jgi:DNA-binding winged helix-turn-helix (wHTH) protein
LGKVVKKYDWKAAGLLFRRSRAEIFGKVFAFTTQDETGIAALVNLRRMAIEPNGSRYRFGVYEADARAGELLRDGSKIKLQEQPFQVLMVLLERAGDVVTREELRQRLWPSDTFVDFDHSLNTAINKLREALRDSASNPRFIETKARRGYRFIAPVQNILEPAAAISTVTNVAKPEPEAGPTRPPLAHGDDDDELLAIPRPHPVRTRAVIGLIQVMYLCFYIAALAHLREVTLVCDRFAAGHGDRFAVAVLVTAVLGIPVRLYLLMAMIFDYRRTGAKFRRIFPALFLLDELWALAPFLLVGRIGIGLAFAATAALLYVPFSQRTLVRLTYPFD